MAMRKEKPKSAAYIKKRNKELSAIYNGLIEEFCAEQIEEIANGVDFDLSVFGREIGESEMAEVWPEIVSFVAIEMAKIDKDKARKILVGSGIPEADVDVFLGF